MEPYVHGVDEKTRCCKDINSPHFQSQFHPNRTVTVVLGGGDLTKFIWKF